LAEVFTAINSDISRYCHGMSIMVSLSQQPFAVVHHHSACAMEA